MTETAPPRPTLRQRWHRLRTSPRFPFVLFFGLLVAGSLSQIYCYWWDVRIERMVVRNQGSVERINVYPPWIRKYLGHQFVRRFEPIRSVRLRFAMPERIERRHDDLQLLRGAFFLRELDLFGELSSDDAKHLRYLTVLKTARVWGDPELVLDGVEQLPKLTALELPFELSTDPSIYRRVAAIPQLERLSCWFKDGAGRSPNVEAGFRELAQSRSLHRLEARLGDEVQLFALTNLLPDGSPPLPQLRELCIGGSRRLTGRSLANLKQLLSLIHLDLSYAEIADKKMAPLKELPYLRTLYLEGNPEITDEAVAVLASMHNLQSLNVKRTNISKAGLLRLAALPRLRCLRAHPGGPEARAELRHRLPAGCELDTN